MRYAIGASGQIIEFAPSVLDHFDRHRQMRFWQPEAGGQLFARFSENAIFVGLATGPRPTDIRTRLSYVPDREAERREIYDFHRSGWHFVGDWHSHPQKIPKPSGRDVKTARSTAEKSRLVLNGVVMVIVGRSPFPAGLFVGIADADDLYSLTAEW